MTAKSQRGWYYHVSANPKCGSRSTIVSLGNYRSKLIKKYEIVLQFNDFCDFYDAKISMQLGTLYGG